MASSIATSPSPQRKTLHRSQRDPSDWVQGLGRIFRRVALMQIRGTEAIVTSVRGIDPENTGHRFSLLEQSPLRWAVEAASPIVNAGRSPGGEQIPHALGISVARAYAVIPFVMHGRLVALAYGDNESDALPVEQVGELFEYCRQLLAEGPDTAAPPPKAAFRSTSRRARSRPVRRPQRAGLRRTQTLPTPPPLPCIRDEEQLPPPPPELPDESALAIPVLSALDAVEAIAMRVANEENSAQELEQSLFGDLNPLPDDTELYKRQPTTRAGSAIESGSSEVCFTHPPPEPLPSVAEIRGELDADAPCPIEHHSHQRHDSDSQSTATAGQPPLSPVEALPAPLPAYGAQPFFDAQPLASEMVVTPHGLRPAHEIEQSRHRGPRHRMWMVATLLTIILGCFTATTVMPPNWGKAAVRVEVPIAATFSEVLTLLEDNELIRSPTAFRLLARISGADRDLQPGAYEFEGATWPWQILDKLQEGSVEMVTTTIPEGLTLRLLANLLEERGITSSSRFVLAARDRRLLDRYGITAESAEGFLFPETYTFARDLPAEKIVTIMIDQFFDRLTGVSNRTLPADELLRRVTLASIIEREAGHPDERQRIAGVFINRIDRDMRLESCATVQYILDKPKERLRIADLRVQSPYNTYLNTGLPPGPIANPGLASLQAALQPEEHDLLFFVAREDGSQKHIFTRSFGAHQAAQKRVKQRRRRSVDVN